MNDLIQRLSDEADQCRNDGAGDIAKLLDEARAALAAPTALTESAASVSAPAQQAGFSVCPRHDFELAGANGCAQCNAQAPSVEAQADHMRERFEMAVFNRRFMASIKRNPNPPRGTGALDFVSVDCPPKAELCKRDGDDYADPTVSAMWWGFRAALKEPQQ